MAKILTQKVLLPMVVYEECIAVKPTFSSHLHSHGCIRLHLINRCLLKIFGFSHFPIRIDINFFGQPFFEILMQIMEGEKERDSSYKMNADASVNRKNFD